MATQLKVVSADGEENDRTELAKRVLKMVSRGETDRNRHLQRLSDCYKFGLPWRHKPNQTQPTDQLDEIFDEELMTVLEDFCADMLNTFTPQKSEWVQAKPVETMDNAQLRQIEAPLAKFQTVIFAEMARSNLYQALQEAYLDLGPGTMAMIVTDLDPAKPVHCEAIPAMDLLLNRGPYGFLDGYWRKVRRPGHEIPVLWPNAYTRKNGKPWGYEDCTDYEVIDGVYRDHSDRANEVWVYVVLCDGEVIWQERYTGQGSNPFIAARWSRDSTTAWGVGPTYRTVPGTKTLNHFRYTSLKNHDKEADPVVSYEDDGVVNIDHGINPGEWVPRAPGSKPPEVIESRSRMDIAAFNIDEVRTAIRRAHYQDRPEQQGKTPPTATQWSDEAAERARRMGTPATNLVIELQYPLFRRFAYLLTKRGKLPKVNLNGEQVALEPISPLLRAQEQEDVFRLDKFAELIAARFGPQMVNVILNPFKWAALVGRKMGIAREVIRDETEIKQTVQQLGPVIGGGGMDYNPPGGGAAAPGGPGGG